MGQLVSSVFGLGSLHELGLIFHRTYKTKYYYLSVLKLQPGMGNLFAAANEMGTLLIYDFLSDSDQPQQFKILGFEYGGVSDLLWINADILVVGTTRGHIVVLSLKNDDRRLFEVCSVKAHGDGASQVPVQGLDYCSRTQRLVSVAQGTNSIRLWNVALDGKLNSTLLDGTSPTAFREPRFVAFLKEGTHLIIGYMEHLSLQIYSIGPPYTMVDERILGQETGALDNRHLGNAVLLEDGHIAVFNLKDGFNIFDALKLTLIGSAKYDVNPCCSQGLSTLQGGRYLICPATKGRIYIFRSQDSTQVGKLTTGRRTHIQAVHSTPGLSERKVVVSSSYIEGQPSKISVWMDTSRLIKSNKSHPEYSTVQIILLCCAVYFLCQMATAMLPFLHSNLPFPPLRADLDPTLSGQTIHASAMVLENSHSGAGAVDLPATVVDEKVWVADGKFKLIARTSNGIGNAASAGRDQPESALVAYHEWKEDLV